MMCKHIRVSLCWAEWWRFSFYLLSIPNLCPTSQHWSLKTEFISKALCQIQLSILHQRGAAVVTGSKQWTPVGLKLAAYFCLIAHLTAAISILSTDLFKSPYSGYLVGRVWMLFKLNQGKEKGAISVSWDQRITFQLHQWETKLVS